MSHSETNALSKAPGWRERLHALRVRYAGLPPRRALRASERDPRRDSPVVYTNGRLCMNCVTPLYGKFCVECGQRDTDLRRPVWTFLLEFIDDVFSLDSRLLRSIGPLIVKPGGLSRRYVEGGRVSVLPPIRMLLVILVVFFLTLELSNVALIQMVAVPIERTHSDKTASNDETTPALPDNDQYLEAADGSANEAQVADESGPESFLAQRNTYLTGVFFQPIDESMARSILKDDDLMRYFNEQAGEVNDDERRTLDFTGRVMHGMNAVAEDPRLMNQVFNQWLPRSLVFLVPVLALFLWLFYWGANSYYFNHLVFSLHLHAFMFLLLTALVLVIPRFSGNVGAWIFFLGMPGYTLLAMKTMYRQGWVRTVFKFCLVVGAYGVLLLLSMVGIMIYGLSRA